MTQVLGGDICPCKLPFLSSVQGRWKPGWCPGLSGGLLTGLDAILMRTGLVHRLLAARNAGGEVCRATEAEPGSTGGFIPAAQDRGGWGALPFE